MALFELIGALVSVIAVLGYLNHKFVGLHDTRGITAMGLLISLVLTRWTFRKPFSTSC